MKNTTYIACYRTHEGVRYVKSTVFRQIRWTRHLSEAKRFPSLLSLFKAINGRVCLDRLDVISSHHLPSLD